MAHGHMSEYISASMQFGWGWGLSKGCEVCLISRGAKGELDARSEMK